MKGRYFFAALYDEYNLYCQSTLIEYCFISFTDYGDSEGGGCGDGWVYKIEKSSFVYYSEDKLQTVVEALK